MFAFRHFPVKSRLIIVHLFVLYVPFFRKNDGATAQPFHFDQVSASSGTSPLDKDMLVRRQF